MTQDYRKRAEEFILSLGDPHMSDKMRICGSPEKLAEAFQQIAQESRREENEACAKIAYKCGENTADTKYRFGIIIASWLISETIRSRMIGPEPMEYK